MGEFLFARWLWKRARPCSASLHVSQAVVPCCVYPRLFATRAIVRWPADTTVLESFHTVNLAKLLEGSKPVWSNSDLCEYFKSAGLLVSFHRFLKRIEQEHFPGS